MTLVTKIYSEMFLIVYIFLRFQQINICVYLQPYLQIVIHIAATVWGLLLHYIIPQMKKQLPWLCCAHPIFKAHEYNKFEVQGITIFSVS